MSEESKTEKHQTSEADETAEVHTDAEKKTYDVDVHIKNLKKSDATKLLVKKAKFLVQEAETQMQACKVIFEKDLEGYEKAKVTLHENGLDESEMLLSQLGYVDEHKGKNNETDVVFEPKNDLEQVNIKELSNGKLSASVLSFLLGAVMLFGLVNIAVRSLALKADIGTVPIPDLLTIVFNWYASLLGMDDHTAVGISFIVLLLLLPMWLVYRFFVRFRTNYNLSVAKDQLESAEAYNLHKMSCQEQMKRVDKFINKSIDLLKLYQVVLNEQQAKLARIYYLEKEKIAQQDFHVKSRRVMRDTQDLVNYIKDFMAVPMSEEGQLSAKSGLFLMRAEQRMEKFIQKLY